MTTLSSSSSSTTQFPNPNSSLSVSKLATTMLPQSQSSSLLTLSFNQDNTCFSASSPTGFRVFSCNPLRQLFRRIFPVAGFNHVVMLYKSNILALVGNGSHPQLSPNKVLLWDDHPGKSFGELCFRTVVRGVCLRRDMIVVALEFKVYVYTFKDFKVIRQVETFANPKGLCVVSQGDDSIVLVCPGSQIGQVRVEHFAKKKINYVWAHESNLACFGLTVDGKFLATASTRGTLIRVFHTGNGALLQEVRRGKNVAEIYSLAFCSTAQWLAVSSDKGTVHVFSLKVNNSNTEHEKSLSSTNSADASSITSFSSSLSLIKIKGVLPKYFNSEWSFAQFRLNEDCRYTVAFGDQNNTLTILGMDGSFYRCQFDPFHGGKMTQLEYDNFLKPEIAS